MELTWCALCIGAVEQCCLYVLKVNIHSVERDEAGTEVRVNLCACSK